MDNLITNFLISIGLLAGLFIVLFIIFWLFSRSIKKRGEVVRSLDMELFLILIPRETTPEEKSKEARERIEPMEQLYSLFSALKPGGFWKRWEYGSPYIVWEMTHIKGKIAFYASAPSRYADALVKGIHSIFPEAVVEPVEDYDIFEPGQVTSASYIVTSRSEILPIKTYQSLGVDPLNNIASAMASLNNDEGASLQIVMRPVKKGWGSKAKKVIKEIKRGKTFEEALEKTSKIKLGNRVEEKKEGETPYQDEEILEAIKSKVSKNNFEVNIRLAVSSPSEARSKAILNEIESAFVQFSSPNLNYFAEDEEKKEKIIYEYSFRLFDKKEKAVLSTEELASVFHLPLSGSSLPGVRWLKARSAPAPWGMSEGISLGVNKYRGRETEVRLAKTDRRRHLYVIGQTGTGKTGLLQRLIHQDVDRGAGLCVIDPHGDLTESILGLIPKERWEDVVLFDPTDLEKPFGLNMLEYNPQHPEQKTFIIDELINIFNKLYDLKATGGPLFEQYTRNALLLLMDYPERGYTLMDVPRVLADKNFRRSLLSQTENPVVKDFWEKEAEKAGGEASLANMVPYITSKFNAFISNDFMRPIVGQSKSSINFRRVMDEGKILLVNLSKGKLGEANMSLLGLIVAGKLAMASFSRGDTPQEERRDFYLYMDEFQNFTTSSAATILSEARKYRLNLILAHQFIGQLPEEISKAVFGNIGTMAIMRIGEEDAEFLSQYLEPLFGAHDLINLDNFHAYVKMIFKGQTAQPFNIKLYSPHKPNPETANIVRGLSRTKYGKERELVREELVRKREERKKIEDNREDKKQFKL